MLSRASQLRVLNFQCQLKIFEINSVLICQTFCKLYQHEWPIFWKCLGILGKSSQNCMWILLWSQPREIFFSSVRRKYEKCLPMTGIFSMMTSFAIPLSRFHFSEWIQWNSSAFFLTHKQHEHICFAWSLTAHQKEKCTLHSFYPNEVENII